MAQTTLIKTEELRSEDQTARQCAHYWVIAPPTDAVSKGVCKKCGTEKDFENFLPSDKGWS